jgi:uncharacterized protein (TIGR02145 family)
MVDVPVPVVITAVKYGLLYNWYAATDERLICAEGWELSSYAGHWGTLISYLGGLSITGGKLKETGFIHFETPNTGASNEVYFNGRGSGSRDSASGVFLDLKLRSNFWTSFSAGDTTARYLRLFHDSALIGTPILFLLKGNGFSIRPIKTATTLTNGQTGTYTGNDGKVYRTICIGTQEWLADNLCETKFRNGDYIPGFDGGVYTPISNAAWAALETAACCAYDNDTSNILI